MFVRPCIIRTRILTTNKIQQIPFIDLFKSALHVSGDKLAHLQEHFLTVYTAFGTVQCTVIAAELVTGWLQYRCVIPKAVYTVKSAPEDGRICRPKHVDQCG